MPSAVYLKVPPEHRQKLNTPLQSAAAFALTAMGVNRLMRPVMSEETAKQLIEAGYVRETFGGYALTDVGTVRAQMENGA